MERIIKNQRLYLALLQKGDFVRYAYPTPQSGVGTATFAGWTKSDWPKLIFKDVDGIENHSEICFADRVTFFEDPSDKPFEEILRERAVQTNPSWVKFVRGAQAICEQYEKSVDADTVLAKIHEAVTDLTGAAMKILDIWENSTDKESVEALFEAIYGMTFTQWLVDAAHEICADKANAKTSAEQPYEGPGFFCVDNIHWDVDEDAEGNSLPIEVYIPLDELYRDDDPDDVTRVDLEERACDWLSDTFGYCHEGFSVDESFSFSAGKEVL